MPCPNSGAGPCEGQRYPIHAISETGRGRTVVEHVPEMAAATAAMNLCPVHTHGRIVAGFDRVRQGLVKARPARAAFELGLGVEKRQRATSATEGSRPMFVEKRRGAGIFGAALSQHVIGGRAQPGPPLRIGERERKGTI